MIYRNARGRLKSQPVRKMPNRSGGEFPKLPPGAVRVAEVHNHPYLQGLALASNAPNYDQAAIDRYLHGVLARPSQADVIRMRFWESQGQAVRTLIVGPDGVLRSY